MALGRGGLFLMSEVPLYSAFLKSVLGPGCGVEREPFGINVSFLVILIVFSDAEYACTC